MNTKKVTDKDERKLFKKLKRAARKKVAPKAKRAADVAPWFAKAQSQEDG